MEPQMVYIHEFEPDEDFYPGVVSLGDYVAKPDCHESVVATLLLLQAAVRWAYPREKWMFEGLLYNPFTGWCDYFAQISSTGTAVLASFASYPQKHDGVKKKICFSETFS